MRLFLLTTTMLTLSTGLLFLLTRPTSRPPARSTALPPTAQALVTLHAPPPAANAGDWRLGPGRAERGQTYEAWRASGPTTTRGARGVLYVVRIGAMSDDHAKLFAQTQSFLGDYFGLPVRALPAVEDVGTWPATARRAHGGTRPQLNSRFLLERILPQRLPADAAALLALTAYDLWPGDDWNFVFGQASLSDRVGVWSLARFGDPGGGDAAWQRCLLRTLKVATHETGHMFSLAHCRAYACTMAGANNLAETDRAPLWLCPECAPKVWDATGVPARGRFVALAARCRAWGLAREAAFYAASAAALPPDAP